MAAINNAKKTQAEQQELASFVLNQYDDSLIRTQVQYELGLLDDPQAVTQQLQDSGHPEARKIQNQMTKEVTADRRFEKQKELGELHNQLQDAEDSATYEDFINFISHVSRATWRGITEGGLNNEPKRKT